jgi:hypothetical protein
MQRQVDFVLKQVALVAVRVIMIHFLPAHAICVLLIAGQLFDYLRGTFGWGKNQACKTSGLFLDHETDLQMVAFRGIAVAGDM